MAGVGRAQSLPLDRILPSNIEAFSKAIPVKLQNKEFAKRYLPVLVDEIVVSDDTAEKRQLRQVCYGNHTNEKQHIGRSAQLYV